MMVGDLTTWLYEDLAGIRPDPERPAFRHIVLYPKPRGDLAAVIAAFDSPYGRIASEWKISDGDFMWNIIVPVNATATVYVPAQDERAVTESG